MKSVELAGERLEKEREDGQAGPGWLAAVPTGQQEEEKKKNGECCTIYP